jgi:hypothetical protein
MLVEYDNKFLMPLLVVAFKIKNLSVVGLSKLIVTDDEELIFGAMASNEATFHGLLKNELGLFCHLPMKLEDCLFFLTWWKSHEICFLNYFFVARKILGILGSQIETKRIFSIVGMLTNLRCCRLGVNNLNKLVMVLKNWSGDAKANCPWKWDSITGFFKEKMSIIEDNDMLLDAIGYFNINELK